MSTTGITPIKVSQLSTYSDIKTRDFFLNEKTSTNTSNYSTFGDLINLLNKLTSKFTGSMTGSFINNNNIVSGSVSGSLQGKLISKNTRASGSFSGSLYGNGILKNIIATGSFSGSLYGSLISKNAKITGSLSGILYGDKFFSKNTQASGNFSGSFSGSSVLINSSITGSASGSLQGKLISKNAKITGSLNGNLYGDIQGTLTATSGKFSGSIVSDDFIGEGKFTGTGSFYGVSNTTLNGKSISFSGRTSHAISSSHALTSSYVINVPNQIYKVYGYKKEAVVSSNHTWSLSVEKPDNAVWHDYKIEVSQWISGNDDTGNLYTIEFFFGFLNIDPENSVNNFYKNDGTGTSTGNSKLQMYMRIDGDTAPVYYHSIGLIREEDKYNNDFSMTIYRTLHKSLDGQTPWYCSLVASYYIP